MADSRLHASFRGVGKNLNLFRKKSCVNKFGFVDVVCFDVAPQKILLSHSYAGKLTMKLFGLVAIIDVSQRIASAMSEHRG